MWRRLGGRASLVPDGVLGTARTVVDRRSSRPSLRRDRIRPFPRHDEGRAQNLAPGAGHAAVRRSGRRTSGLRDEVARLRAENSRLLRLLELTPEEARPAGPMRTGVFDAAPGPVHAGSPAAAKVAFFAALLPAPPGVDVVRAPNPRRRR